MSSKSLVARMVAAVAGTIVPPKEPPPPREVLPTPTPLEEPAWKARQKLHAPAGRNVWPHNAPSRHARRAQAAVALKQARAKAKKPKP